MRLTRFSDIGLRVLMYLARSERELPAITVAEIALQFGVPRNHLVKVVGLMAKQGWLSATRGRSGGLRLARDPHGLHLGAVLRVLEGEEELIDCDTPPCPLRRDCALRHALQQAQRQFYAAMDQHTLADICAGKTGEKIATLRFSYLKDIGAQAAP